MYRDVAELRQFYQSALGRQTAQMLRRMIARFWPDLHEAQTLVGVGYAIPYLSPHDHRRSFAVMNATQGVVRWPMHEPNRTVLCEDHVLPLLEHSVDRLLLVHAVENADYLKELMAECWRVLAPNGRVLLIVPNRAGLWARSDKTPFGHGRPYSMKQVRALLRAEQFVVERQERTLYALPSHRPLLRALGPLLERFGGRFLPKMGGVLMIEASKQLYSVTPLPVNARTVVPQTVWNGAMPSPTG